MTEGRSEPMTRWFHDPWRYSAVGVVAAILTVLLYVFIGEIGVGTFVLVTVGMVLLYLPMVWMVSGIDSAMTQVIDRG